MDFALPDPLLSPQERSAVVARINEEIFGKRELADAGFTPLSVTAYPYGGRIYDSPAKREQLVPYGGRAYASTTHRVQVVVHLGTTHPVQGDFLLSWPHLVVSPRIVVVFGDISKAGIHAPFDFGAHVLGEQLLIDPLLTRATAVLALKSAVSPACVAGYHQAKHFWQQVQWPNAEVRQEAAIVAAARFAIRKFGDGDQLDTQGIFHRAAEALPIFMDGATPGQRWKAVKANMNFGDGRPLSSLRALEVHEALTAARAAIRPPRPLDAVAVATRTLLTNGAGSEPIVKSVRSKLVGVLANHLAVPAVAAGQEEEFLL